MTEIRQAVEAFAADVQEQAVVLDVGCGLRPYEDLFEHCTYIGIDVDASGRTEREKRADRLFDGVQIPYEDARFDAVFCTQVLEHALEPEALLRDIHRVLRVGGRLLVTVPFMWGEHEPPFDFRRFSSFGIRRVIEAAGFRVLRQDRLTRGVDAIEMLVHSEINNFTSNVRSGERQGERWQRRVAVWVEARVWTIQRSLWRRLYRFERIYVDNLVIAEKRG
jgi:SAM-dependent methyltransferase